MINRRWIDCDANGLDVGAPGITLAKVRLPYVWSEREQVLDYPVAIIGRGHGPTVLLTGGTHGDELEGQAVARHLVQVLSASEVAGRLIVVPTHNLPACLVGTRESPIDGMDLNRIFPGGEAPGPSHAIARFVSRTLMPECAAYLDLHSGGRAYEFVLSSNLQGRPGTPHFERDLPALLAMDAPYAIVFDEDDTDIMPHHGTAEAYMRELGRPAFSSEFGGGRMTARSFKTALRGTVNLLHYLGVMTRRNGGTKASRSRLLFMHGRAQYVTAPQQGLLVPRAGLGSRVAAGSLLGHVLPIDLSAPVAEIRCATAGIVVAVATTCPAPGDPAFMIAEPLPR